MMVFAVVIERSGVVEKCLTIRQCAELAQACAETFNRHASEGVRAVVYCQSIQTFLQSALPFQGRPRHTVASS